MAGEAILLERSTRSPACATLPVMRTFKLDDVDEACALPDTQSLGTLIGDVLCLGAEPATRVLETRGAHPLIASVHAAFAEHRPLRLSPDAVWLTIAQHVLPDQRCIATCTDYESSGTLYVLCDAGRIQPPAQLTDVYVDPVTGPLCDPSAPRAERVPSSSLQPIEEIPVVATSLAAVLQHALTSKGDPQLPSIALLVDRLPAWLKEPPLSTRRRSERS